MKRHIIVIFLSILYSILCNAQVLTISTSEPVSSNTWLCYRMNINIDRNPSNIECRIAADSKYWLWVNGELIIREGGLKRGPNPKDTYCDVLSNVKGLQKGNNTIAVLVWYFGKDGFSHRNSPTPGLFFNLMVNGKKIKTNDNWKVIKFPAIYTPKGEKPNYRLPESNIGFNSENDINFHNEDYDDSKWNKAHQISLDEAGWNKLVDRPIPFWKDYGLKSYTKTEIQDDKIIAYLPYNAQITPYIKLKATSGCKIDIRTDNYRGGSATNVFAEYITCEGIQEFECLGWMNGHYVIYTIPEGCEVLDLKYRETGYDTDFAGSFWCNDPFLTSLWTKSQRTLYITMRDTYMDCPDRERAQWWGDVVNELGEAFYALEEKAHLLTRKGIRELMDWQRADSTIYAPVPSGNYNDELPMQMLASVGYYGFWTYYMGTGDKDLIEYVFSKVKKYIHVWKTSTEGLVIPRKGGWTWGDWGDNKDMELLFNLWYSIALDGYSHMARLLNEESQAKWADETNKRLRTAFHKKYWNGKFYKSLDYQGLPDDRAQALAVVSGILPKDLYPIIRPFFKQQYHASPYMEKYVLQALCEMGYYQDAMDRMRLRYGPMVNSALTTLWEGWGIGKDGFGGGSYNHAWSGGPLTILSSYIAGIKTVEPGFKVFSVCPNLGNLNQVKVTVPLNNNRFITADLKKTTKKCILKLSVPEGSSAIINLPNNYNKIEINDKLVKTGYKLKKGEWEIIFS